MVKYLVFLTNHSAIQGNGFTDHAAAGSQYAENEDGAYDNGDEGIDLIGKRVLQGDDD